MVKNNNNIKNKSLEEDYSCKNATSRNNSNPTYQVNNFDNCFFISCLDLVS